MNNGEIPTTSGSLLERVLQVRPGEGRRTGLLFMAMFAASGTFVLGRTLRDTVFLSRAPISALPWMFVLYGVGSSAVALLYGRYADRIPVSRLLYITTGTGIITYVATWWLVRAQIPWVYPFFYVWAELVPNLFFLQFWTLAAGLDCPRDARRLNTTVAAARPLGTIFFGVATGSLIPWIGTVRIFFILVFLMILLASCVYLLRHEPRRNESSGVVRPPVSTVPGRVHLLAPYIRALSILILVMFITLTLGDYQFKAIASARFNEDAMARFFSLFYGVTGLLSMSFQLFITPRILSRLGVGSALTVLPGVFGTSSVVLLMWPGLAAACAMKFADNGLQYTLHETTMQSLYAPFPSRVRGRTRTLLDGAVKPLSYGAGGLLLVFLTRAGFDVRQMCFVTLSFALLWQTLIPLVRRGYLRALERGLAGPMAAQLFQEPFLLGAAERQMLIQTLDSPDALRAMVALEQLQSERSAAFRDALARILRRRDGALKARAIALLDRLGDHTCAHDFLAASKDEDSAVRAAAVTALARVMGNEQPETLYRFMTDPDTEVRTEAAAGLIRYGCLEGLTRAGEALLRLESSSDPADRRETCAVLGKLGHVAYLSLNTLLRDPDPSVVRAAIRAASGAADPRLVPAIIGALYEPQACKAAMAALAVIGAPAISFIDRAMRDAALPRAIRLELPRTLSRIPSPESFAVLQNHQEDSDSHFRLRVYAALGRLRKALGVAPFPVRQLEPRIRREVLEACGNLVSWDQARHRFKSELLGEEMEFRIRRAERRILRLLELRYNLDEVSVILAALEDPARRPDALDALDALLTASLRELVLPVLEQRSSPEKLQPLFASQGICALPPAEFVLLQAYHPNPYVALLALDALARAGEKSAIPAARQALQHRDPLVREGGLRALQHLDPEGACAAAAGLSSDPDPALAGWARGIADRHVRIQQDSCELVAENDMYGTVEKILFLKSTPLFSELSGEDLAPLARVAEVVTVYPGDFVFRGGLPSDHLYVVINGLVALEDRGRELRRVGPPETIGELAVLDRGVLATSARAVEVTELLRIGSEEFFEIVHEQPEIAEALLRILAGQLRQAQQQLIKQAEEIDVRGAKSKGAEA
jgi:ATP/ADP translocase/HEAT repeat protein